MATYESTDELIQLGEIHARFRTFAAGLPDQERQIVAENLMWFADVRSLDYTFEGRPLFTWSDLIPTREDVMALSYRQEPFLPLFARLELVERMLTNVRDDAERTWMMARIEEETREIYGRSSVCCFCTDPRLHRLWGQYADNGRGYALLFDFRTPWRMEAFAGHPAIDMVPFPIVYRAGPERPAIELSLARNTNNPFEDVEHGLLTKSEVWRDQAEERIVRIGLASGLVPFPADSLCGVVLGYASDQFPERRQGLIDLCRKGRSIVPVYQARRSMRGYEIELHPLDGA